MNNYLGNLIARHLNRVEVLQPRVASRFEPQSSVLQAEPEVVQPPADEMDVVKPSHAKSETTATESMFAPASDGPVAGRAVQPAPTTETTPLEASGAPPVIQQANATPPSQPAKSQPAVSVFTQPVEGPIEPAQLSEPTIVLNEQREKREKPVEQANNVHSARRAEVFDSETPVPETYAVQPSAAPSLMKKSQPAKTLDQVVLPLPEAKDVEERSPVQSGPAHATKTQSPRVVAASPTQMLTPSLTNNVQVQAPIPQTENVREQAVQNTVTPPFVHSVARAEVRRNVDSLKLGHTEAPADSEPLPPVVLPAAVIPAREELRSVVVHSAERENPTHASPDPRKRNSEETSSPHPTQRAPALETVVTGAPRTDAISARRQFRDEATSVKAEPTVNVTIGRIEVRAATKIPEAQPQKERREHQVLSLDEYLSQRSAGGR